MLVSVLLVARTLVEQQIQKFENSQNRVNPVSGVIVTNEN